MLQKRKFQIVFVIALICWLAGFLPGCSSIKYYNGNCCCIAKDVLIEMKNRIEQGEIIIDSLKSKEYVNGYLKDLCWLLKSEQDLEDLKELGKNSR